MYDGKSILREFNANVNMLDDELKRKLDIRLDILRDLIFKLKPTVNLPDEDIPVAITLCVIGVLFMIVRNII